MTCADDSSFRVWHLGNQAEEQLAKDEDIVGRAVVHERPKQTPQSSSGQYLVGKEYKISVEPIRLRGSESLTLSELHKQMIYSPFKTACLLHPDKSINHGLVVRQQLHKQEYLSNAKSLYTCHISTSQAKIKIVAWQKKCFFFCLFVFLWVLGLFCFVVCFEQVTHIPNFPELSNMV